jgi:hypothetical protein
MIRKTAIVLLAIFLAVASFTGLAGADTYYVYNQWGGTWHDANKNWNGDSNLCWAGAASNILAWAGRGTPAYNTETAIFQYFKGNWTDQGGLPWVGWQWWFNGTNAAKDVPGYAQLTRSDSGNFWSGVTFDNYVHEKWYSPADHQTSNLMATVDNYLHSGYGVTLGIYMPNGSDGWYGHALTAWGFNYTGQGGSRTYSSIYVTDSDDHVTALQNYLLSWDATNQWWYLSNYLDGGWHLADVEGLDQHTPVPSSLLLLASGLLGLVGLRRLRKT